MAQWNPFLAVCVDRKLFRFFARPRVQENERDDAREGRRRQQRRRRRNPSTASRALFARAAWKLDPAPAWGRFLPGAVRRRSAAATSHEFGSVHEAAAGRVSLAILVVRAPAGLDEVAVVGQNKIHNNAAECGAATRAPGAVFPRELASSPGCHTRETSSSGARAPTNERTNVSLFLPSSRALPPPPWLARACVFVRPSPENEADPPTARKAVSTPFQ